MRARAELAVRRRGADPPGRRTSTMQLVGLERRSRSSRRSARRSAPRARRDAADDRTRAQRQEASPAGRRRSRRPRARRRPSPGCERAGWRPGRERHGQRRPAVAHESRALDRRGAWSSRRAEPAVVARLDESSSATQLQAEERRRRQQSLVDEDADERPAGDDGRLVCRARPGAPAPRRARPERASSGSVDNGQRLLVVAASRARARARRLIRSNIHLRCALARSRLQSAVRVPAGDGHGALTSRNESESAAWRRSSSRLAAVSRARGSAARTSRSVSRPHPRPGATRRRSAPSVPSAAACTRRVGLRRERRGRRPARRESGAPCRGSAPRDGAPPAPLGRGRAASRAYARGAVHSSTARPTRARAPRASKRRHGT